MLNKREFREHLVDDLLPFWDNLYDGEHGGFYGRVDGDNKIYRQAAKAAVLQTRILWFYSSCYRLLGDARLLEHAGRQFDFISRHMLDPGDGGIYWSVGHDGRLADTSKQAYALAFALYSASAYYSAARSRGALAAADRLFDLLESKFRDEHGYLEFADSKAGRTMNTLLHIIEAYTEYYQAAGAGRAGAGLRYALGLVADKAYNAELRRLECHFDELMRPVGDMLSYGHDIEASWLIYRACEALGDAGVTATLGPALELIAQNVIAKGFVDGGSNGVYYECKDGADNKSRSWWVMSEAIVALAHQYKLYGRAESMLIAGNLWEYVKSGFISQYGEWHMHVDDSGAPVKGDLCNAWKCPYHNGRMCIEILGMIN